jgi:hypothetical protein
MVSALIESLFFWLFTTMTLESFDDSKFLKYLGKIYKSMLSMESLKHLARNVRKNFLRLMKK